MNGASPAGFWIRVVAFVIDLGVLGLVQLSLGVAARRMWGADVEASMTLRFTVGVFTLVFAGLYVTLLHATTGQTVGKLLVGVRVVLVDGARVPVGASFLRFLASFLSSALLGFGYLIAGLRRDKRALHDLIAGTRVERDAIRMPAPVDSPEAVAPPLA